MHIRFASLFSSPWCASASPQRAPSVSLWWSSWSLCWRIRKRRWDVCAIPDLSNAAIHIYSALWVPSWFSFLFQEEVIQAVEKVCTYLPKSLSTECKDLIETYGQAIIELLVQQADPKTVCTVLALCNEARRTYVGKFIYLTARTHTHTSISLACCSLSSLYF